MNYVFDAGALIAMLEKERGAEVVQAILRSAGAECYCHAINLCEVYYPLVRTQGTAAAQQVIAVLISAGVQPRSDIDMAFWQDAGATKASYRLSLGDAFGVALARRLGAEFVTTDHGELEPLLTDGICQVNFIR